MTIEKFKRFILLLALVLGVVAVPTAPVGAINVFDGKACTDATQDSKVCKGKNETISPLVSSIVNVLLFAIGIISVIMIIVGGLRYVTSNGDASQVTAAKNTILYAVIGLVVALLAFAIVNFVVSQFK
jgi:hypothetical protein